MADAPLTALEQALNVALVEARSIAHAQPVGLTPTYHNQLRRAGEKRPYNMADAKRDARNAVTAIEQAFEALIAYQAVAATPSPPVAAVPATPVDDDDDWLAQKRQAMGMDWAAQPQPQPAQPLTGAVDATRYQFLCAHPDWRFIEALCLQFSANNAAEFKAGMDRAIDTKRGAGITNWQAVTAPSTPTPAPGEKS